MLVAVIAAGAGHHGNVRFRLGLVVQCDRRLRSYQPPWSKGRAECVLDETDCRVMFAALRLADDHLTAKQFDGIVGLEEAGIDEPVVLQPRPAARSERVLHHRTQATPRGKTRSMSLLSDTASWSPVTNGRRRSGGGCGVCLSKEPYVARCVSSMSIPSASPTNTGWMWRMEMLIERGSPSAPSPRAAR